MDHRSKAEHLDSVLADVEASRMRSLEDCLRCESGHLQVRNERLSLSTMMGPGAYTAAGYDDGVEYRDVKQDLMEDL